MTEANAMTDFMRNGSSEWVYTYGWCVPVGVHVYCIVWVTTGRETSTTKGIWTVGNIDGHPIGDGKPGEFSAKLYEKLLEEMNIMTS